MPSAKNKKIDAAKPLAAGSFPTGDERWHNLSLAETAAKLKVGKIGLTAAETAARLARHGYNELPEEPPSPGLILFFRQFHSVLIYILLAAAGISFYLGDRVDASVILAAILANVVVGFIQEYKAQKSLSALKKIITPEARVVREGREHLILARELVVGDIVILDAGDKVPSDGRIFEVEHLKINEAALTGESEPVDKINRALEGELTIADQHNMVFSGTIVTEGRGKFFVTATGLNTEIGQIAAAVKNIKPLPTPLQEKLAHFSRTIGLAVLGLSSLLFLVGLYFKHNFTEMFTTAVAVAVAAVPEGLAVAVTMILALGMQRILKKGSLVRKLSAAETLGSTSVICVDKTGTITVGEMRVVRLASVSHDIDTVANGHKLAEIQKGLWEMRLLHYIGLVCNNAVLSVEEEESPKLQPASLAESLLGSPTETAILLSAVESGFGLAEARLARARLDELPFSSEQKFMATLNNWTDKQNVIYYKGSPEKILSMSAHCQVGRAARPLDAKKRREFERLHEKLSRAGLRVLAAAYQPVAQTVNNLDKLPNWDANAVFVGFWGIADPIRATVAATIVETRQSGIHTIMLTGDNKHTAASIARQAGLDPSDGKIMEGKDLAAMSDAQLARAIQKVEVFARVTPQDKLRIVEALQTDGEVVAMTGDGVNDAPALARADIGLAFGSGTDVAKETADVVLLDNNFSTIVAAVRQGRIIFDNIRKVVLYHLSDSFSEMLIIAVSILLGWPLPILAAQILWINLVTDSPPSLALAAEPEEEGVMSEKPLPREHPILDYERKFLIVFISVIKAAAALGLFYLIWKTTGNLDRARTIAFMTVTLGSLLYVFSVRTVRRTIFETRFFANKWLVAAVGGGFLLQLLGVYNGFFQGVLKTVPLGIADWLLVLFACVWVVILIELAKYLFIAQKREKAA